jgi:hypothetical protein
MYTYRPLKTPLSIRLIELLPGTGNERLQCRLLDGSMDNPPLYAAVSYVWGDETQRYPMICDDADMDITQNLAAALLRFRKKTSSVILWVDSICMNQKDELEKTHQVRLMGDIYQKAEVVLIWLGDEEEGDDTKEAFQCMGMLLRQITPRADDLLRWKTIGGTTSPGETRNSEEINAEFNIPEADSVGFVALRKLLRRPWFFRAWTFQESFLAVDRYFSLGRYGIGGQQMVNVFSALSLLDTCTDDWRYLEGDLQRIFPMVAGLKFWTREGFMSHNFTTLPVLLHWRGGAGCKDARDLVYSILGVVEDGTGIRPDYSKPFEHVFAQTAAGIITTTGNLSILRSVDVFLEQSTLPSWVPDWRSYFYRPGNPVGSQFSADRRAQYSCTGSSRARILLSANGRELKVQGLNWDRIVAVKETYDEDWDGWAARQLYSNVGNNARYEATGESIINATMRIRCLDRNP